MKTRTIEVNQLARVEGESSLRVTIEAGEVRDVQLAIFEPPRYFEALLRGRSFREAPDITARICGICPVAYQMTAVHALENAAGVSVPAPIAELRRLLYCGEWIESHALHIHMLHAPDFFGHADAIELARQAPEAVKRGLAMKKTGNALVSLIGGREIHPINVQVGGFYKIPDATPLKALLTDLRRARDDAAETVRWVSSLIYPDIESNAILVALKNDREYPMNHGRVASTHGLDIAMHEFNAAIKERQVPYSTALQAELSPGGEHYLTGPLARLTLNYELLTPLCQSLAAKAGVAGGTRNPYKSIIVRALEVLYAFEEAIRIIETIELPTQASVPVDATGCSAFWATEAPRGLLFHHYEIDNEGDIEDAQIIPPTSQNQSVIEQDLANVIRQNLDADDAVLARHCEDAVRNHDPCISCATHFLKVSISRRS